MFHIAASTVDSALWEGAYYMTKVATPEESRNGPVLVLPRPVITHYSQPRNRVLFNPARDANPFFHLLEALWMLAGEKRVDLVGGLLPRMYEYSDDGRTLNGAYGWRWRKNWGSCDQLKVLIQHLRRNPQSRRAVLQMWDPERDLRYDAIDKSKDVPCNLSCVFQISGGALNMAVFNRSNDMLWGAYGANAVHFSMLHEYMAGMLLVPLGWMEQISVNMHVYHKTWIPYLDRLRNIGHVPTAGETPFDRYHTINGGRVHSYPLVTDFVHFDSDLKMFMELWKEGKLYAGDVAGEYKNRFFSDIAVPMFRAYACWQRDRKPEVAAEYLTFNPLPSNDWIVAGREWLERRVKK